jgi:ubiquinone/menaquinone biosynthesis C-methylase UbiE
MLRHHTVLAIAVISFLGCSSWKRFAYEGFDRDSWQQPELVISSLELEKGDRVADLGAGGGYFTFRLADAVGPEGRVYAIDVDPDMTAYLAERAAEEGHENVEVILAETDDPGLPDGEIDLLFTSNTYHHLEDRTAYFAARLRDLKLGGRVAILEMNGVGWFSRWFGHLTEKEVIVEEMRRAGFRVERDLDFVDRQHFLIFRVGS